MRPFKINVTTDRAVFDAAAQNKKMMCIVTPTRDAAPGQAGLPILTHFMMAPLIPAGVSTVLGSARRRFPMRLATPLVLVTTV